MFSVFLGVNLEVEFLGCVTLCSTFRETARLFSNGPKHFCHQLLQALPLLCGGRADLGRLPCRLDSSCVQPVGGRVWRLEGERKGEARVLVSSLPRAPSPLLRQHLQQLCVSWPAPVPALPVWHQPLVSITPPPPHLSLSKTWWHSAADAFRSPVRLLHPSSTCVTMLNSPVALTVVSVFCTTYRSYNINAPILLSTWIPARMQVLCGWGLSWSCSPLYPRVSGLAWVLKKYLLNDWMTNEWINGLYTRCFSWKLPRISPLLSDSLSLQFRLCAPWNSCSPGHNLISWLL